MTTNNTTNAAANDTKTEPKTTVRGWDTANSSESAKERAARLLKELTDRYHGLSSTNDVQAARIEALSLGEDWYMLARGAWANKSRDSVYELYLAQSDAWYDIHDKLAGAGWFSKSYFRRETAAWRDRDGALKQASEYAKDAGESSKRAAGYAGRAEQAEEGARKSETRATEAAARAEVHAEYAKKVAREVAEQVAAENVDALSKAVEATVRRVLAEKPTHKGKAA